MAAMVGVMGAALSVAGGAFGGDSRMENVRTGKSLDPSNMKASKNRKSKRKSQKSARRKNR